MDARLKLRILKVSTVVASLAIAVASLYAGALSHLGGVLFLAWMIAPGAMPYFVLRMRTTTMRFIAMGTYLVLFGITAAVGYSGMVRPTSGGFSFAPIFLPIYQWVCFAAVLLILMVFERFADKRTAEF